MLSQHYGESANYGSGSNRTKNQAYKLLLSNFGGKRAASLLERKERMKINVDIVKDQLDKTVVDASGKIDVDTKDNFDLSQAEREQHLESMVPPMNKEAKRLNEVYRLTDLIPESLLNRLDSEAMQLLQTKIEEIPLVHRSHAYLFILFILNSILQNRNEILARYNWKMSGGQRTRFEGKFNQNQNCHLP